MKYLFFILPTLFSFQTPSVWCEEVDYLELLKRDGLYYKNFSEEPFTGTSVGEWRGEVIKGKEQGTWTIWYDNGKLESRVTYKDGKLEGPYEWYSENGQLAGRGRFQNGKQVGKWEYYKKDGTLDRVENVE